MGVLVHLFLVSWTMSLRSPITSHSARARVKGSHMLLAIVQVSIGEAVSLLIASMRPKK